VNPKNEKQKIHPRSGKIKPTKEVSLLEKRQKFKKYSSKERSY